MLVMQMYSVHSTEIYQLSANNTIYSKINRKIRSQINSDTIQKKQNNISK